MRKMYDNHRIIFSEKSDNDTLNEYVYKDGYVLVRDRPAISHLIYNDYILRKRTNPDDERKQCPFAVAKDPFMKRRRSFAYRLDSELSLLFDEEYVKYQGVGRSSSSFNLLSILGYYTSSKLVSSNTCSTKI